MGGWVSDSSVYGKEYACFFEDPHFDADMYVVDEISPTEAGTVTKVIDFDCYMSGGTVQPDTISEALICAHTHDFPCNFQYFDAYGETQCDT